MGYIYKITNNINGKSYIGKTEITPEIRFKRHQFEFKREKKKDRPLYRAFRKYGIENFSLETLEECNSGQELCDREIYYIEKYNTFKNGYNCTVGGDGKSYLDYDLIYKTYLKCNKHYGDTAKKLGISKKNLKNQLENRFSEKIHKDEQKIWNKKIVIMYDLIGNKLKEFESCHEAGRFLNKINNKNANYPHISEVCNNKRKTAYGYIWKYKEDDK